MIVYVNGKWLDDKIATVSYQDRAFVFADAVYEVVHIYNEKYFKLDLHLERMQKGLDKLRIPYNANDFKPVMDELLKRTPGIKNGMLYVQISRGAAPSRVHSLPELEPSIVAYVNPLERDTKFKEEGGKAVFVEDIRWQMCNIKTTGLLLNCMAKEDALQRGANDAFFHRGEIVTEASASNLFIVKNGTLWTHPNGNWILPGITRHVVIELAKKLGIPVKEEQFTKADLLAADEVFLTGTNSEVSPYVEVEGKPIGTGKVGPITRKLLQAYYEEAQIS